MSLFEPVRSCFVSSFLKIFKAVSPCSETEIYLDNISENFTNFAHETRNLHEKMINNISGILFLNKTILQM